MTLVELELKSGFRSLPKGFRIHFDRPLQSQQSSEVQPLCLVGPNGSGKSNLLQVLANIFYYLELYVLSKARGYSLPQSDSKNMLSFSIHYLMPVTPKNYLSYVDASGLRQYEEEVSRVRSSGLRGVIITKLDKQEPVFEFYYGDDETKQLFGKNDVEKSMLGCLLPNRVIGYSSGSNEILSNPFAKMDFFYLEELRRKTEAGKVENQPNTIASPTQTNKDPWLSVNRLFYMDYHSNAMMVVANFLMKRNSASTGKEAELDIINEIVQLSDLHSFRIRMRLYIRNQIPLTELLASLEPGYDAKDKMEKLLPMRQIILPPELEDVLKTLIKCATLVNEINVPGSPENVAAFEMHYFVDDEMKSAFLDHFKGEKGALHLFERLYLLNLLNIENYTNSLRDQIKSANFSDNIYDLLPKLPAEERVFYIDDIKLKKTNGAQVLYKQLSDGEHQYLQVAGSLMLMDENASLFLMDEPETHFNPEWRSKLVSTLNQIRQRKKELEQAADQQRFELVQDIMLTTHSPFILSDSQRENVYIFKKENGNLILPIPKPDFNTFGASVNLITSKVFGKRDTIAGMAKDKLKALKSAFDDGEKDGDTVIDEAYKLGDSVERMLLLDYVEQQMTKTNTP